MEVIVQLPQCLPSIGTGIYMYYDDSARGGLGYFNADRYTGMRVPYGNDDEFRMNGGLYSYEAQVNGTITYEYPACSANELSFLSLLDSVGNLAHTWRIPIIPDPDGEAPAGDVMDIIVQMNHDQDLAPLPDFWGDCDWHPPIGEDDVGWAEPDESQTGGGKDVRWYHVYNRRRRSLAIPRVQPEGVNSRWELNRTVAGLNAGSCRAFMVIEFL